MLDGLRAAARRSSDDKALRAVVRGCSRLLSERAEANSVAIASELIDAYGRLPEAQRAALFQVLASDFSPDPKEVLEAAVAYAQAPTAQHQVRLSEAAEPPRQELLRRINRAPGGTACLIGMRRELLALLRHHPELAALEADFLHLLSSWFNPGFLRLQKVDWESPAQLLEQLIRHEAVHAIDGWDDLRRRLLPDRRCYAFFHPQLPGEPLIFVEVALLPEMPATIAPLIAKGSEPLSSKQFKVAAFYSISNCQPGLRGVSLGNFLIKHVASELQRELPQLKRFCTLSPIPCLLDWLLKSPDFEALPGVKKAHLPRLQAAQAQLRETFGAELAGLAQLKADDALGEPTQQALLSLCAAYLVYQSPSADGDPVARFHLDNGARLERLNPGGNLSRKGFKQSAGLMVNYLYDLAEVENRHELFTQGEVAHARGVAALL
jgi:malonyl-CoA decarboxylase